MISGLNLNNNVIARIKYARPKDHEGKTFLEIENSQSSISLADDEIVKDENGEPILKTEEDKKQAKVQREIVKVLLKFIVWSNVDEIA